MVYTISQLSKLSGVTTRTLRYYDEIGLLLPKYIANNGYRIYGQEEVDRLQQILFLRQLKMPLNDIKSILSSPGFDKEKTLQNHLISLYEQKEQLDLLIANVQKTIRSMKGEIEMNDNEKFEGLKQAKIQENEEKYGKEIRRTYGDEVIDASNEKLMAMSQEKYNEAESLAKEINRVLKEAMKKSDPAGELAQKACKLHKKWLLMFWNEKHYSKAAHRSLGEMYVADERYTKYYNDAIAPGAAKFLADALYCFTEE